MHVSELYSSQCSKYNSRELRRHEIMDGVSGSYGTWVCSIVVGSTEIGNSMHGYNNTEAIFDSSPTYASYTNSSTNSITFIATLRRPGGGNANMLFYQSSGIKT